MLVQELAALQQLDFDLNLGGFSADELSNLFQGDLDTGLTNPDDVPAPPDQARTQAGDLWLLGDHRLLCGDAGRAEDVDRLLEGAPVHLVNTDPPYNVKVEPRSNNAIAAGLSAFTTTHHQKLDVTRHPRKTRPPAALLGIATDVVAVAQPPVLASEPGCHRAAARHKTQ